jgi:hypothetical protein
MLYHILDNSSRNIYFPGYASADPFFIPQLTLFFPYGKTARYPGPGVEYYDFTVLLHGLATIGTGGAGWQ